VTRRRGAIYIGASVINFCYAARGIRVSSTTTKTVDCTNLTFSESQRSIADGKISLNVSRRVVSPAWIAGVLISRPKIQRHVRPDEVVVSSEATPGDLRDAPSITRGRSSAKKISRALSDREVQPLDERSVQFRGVLGVAQRLFESPRVTDQHSSLDLDDAIVPARLDHLAYRHAGPKMRPTTLL
jgi:hypothetical protein